MFYIKTKLSDGRKIKVELTDENVFTRCPDCGCELPIDLAEIFSDGDGDLFSTSVVCSSCTKKRSEKHCHVGSAIITLDSLALLVETFRDAGYYKELIGIFDEFDIESLSNLQPIQYQTFTEALKKLAGKTNNKSAVIYNGKL